MTRKLIKSLTVFTFIMTISFPAQGADYYVNSTDLVANDNNAGTQAFPWINCPGMPDWSGTQSLNPGDTVYFANTATWSAASGFSIIQAQAGITYDGSTWGHGERATLEATGPLARSVINFMEDHATYATIVRGFEVDANGLITTGIGMNWPSAAISLSGATKRIEDCIVHDVMSASASGQYEYGIVVSAGYGGSLVVANVEIIECVTYNISRGGINIYAPNDDPASRIESVVVRGCEIWATGLDPNYAGSALAIKNHVKNCVVEYNSVHNVTRGTGIGISSHETGFRGPENSTIRYNIVRDCPSMGININSKGSISVDIYGNLLLKNAYQGLRFMDVADHTAVRVFNNTFFENHHSSGWCHSILIGDDTAIWDSLEVRNNLFVAHSACLPLDDYYGLITNHSNNLYFRSGGGSLARSNATSYSSATINTFEPSAYASDPSLVDSEDLPIVFTGSYPDSLRPDTEGLSVNSGSDAINNGAALGSPYHGSINSITRPWDGGWDIGAYENIPGLLFIDNFEAGNTTAWSAIVP